MRRLFLFLGTVLIASSAFAVAPQFWLVRSAEDFLAGETTGFAVTSRGELRPAPALTKLATFSDPFVLSQASSPNGDHFFGTGNDGKVYRLRGTESKVLFTAPEPEIYALVYRDGALYAGTSPNGKVYRIDPDSGKESIFFDPAQAYIWALAPLPNGALAVATGVEGKLFRVSPDGKGTVLFDAPDTHIRSIAVRGDGTILAGASGKGRIYEIRPDGSSARALFDSPLNEITSIYVDANGTGWAAGVSNVLPSTAPAKPAAKPAQPQKQQQQQQEGGAAPGEAPKEQETPAVEVSFSFDDGAAAASQPGTAEVYRIDRDGFVETVRKFDREMVYSIGASRSGGVLLGTGPNGRIYQLRDGELALIDSVPEKQVVSLAESQNATLVTTTNSGALYRMEQGLATASEFLSAPKDVERFSRFGNYRIEGRNLAAGAVSIAFRSGNTRTPDETWSGWSAAQTAYEGKVSAPPARYVQWKLTMTKPVAEAAVDSVSVAFVNRNVAPEIESITVQDPGVVLVNPSYSNSPQILEATNPDEYGIFSSLDTPRDRTAAAEQGKRMFRKGYRTVTWRASDDNGDDLRYALAFRKKGEPTWLRLRDDMDATQLNFDTSQLPDGVYELRLTASDAEDNADAPMKDVKEGFEFLVDNTAPRITVSDSGADVTITISDAASPIGKVEYAVNAEKWIPLTPVDGLADSREETFRLSRSAVAGKFVVVRAVDSSYNVATASVTSK